jgi:hypothetical protein
MHCSTDEIVEHGLRDYTCALWKLGRNVRWIPIAHAAWYLGDNEHQLACNTKFRDTMGTLERHHQREQFQLDWLRKYFLAKFDQPIHMAQNRLEKTRSLEVVLVAIQMYQCGTVMISVASHLAYLFRHEFQRQWSPFNVMTLQKYVDFPFQVQYMFAGKRLFAIGGCRMSLNAVDTS